MYPEFYESVLEETVTYPMTYNEFKERVKELCIFYSSDDWTDDIVEFFDSNENEELFKTEYMNRCREYLEKRRDAFEDYVLKMTTVRLLKMLEW